MTHDWRLCYDK